MESFFEAKVVVITCTVIVAIVTMWFFTKSKQKQPVALDKTTKISLTLTRKTIVSHDTRQFRFSLPSPDHVLGLPVGGFITVSATLDDKLVVRPYTPITSDDEVGYMDLMLKVYKEGKMSSYLDQLTIGDNIMVRGPAGKIRYLGNSVFEVEKSKNSTINVTGRKVGMVAGGSGITPMLQFIREVLKREDDKTEMSLIFSNKTYEDILCREMLEEMCCPKLKVCHTLSQKPVPKDWNQGTGRVNGAMLEQHLPAPAQDTVILLCGPPGLVKQTCLPFLLEMGHEEQNILVF